jgi:hypothetical protein
MRARPEPETLLVFRVARAGARGTGRRSLLSSQRGIDGGRDGLALTRQVAAHGQVVAVENALPLKTPR